MLKIFFGGKLAKLFQAEFVGTFILVALGTSVNTTLFLGGVASPLACCVGWGITLALAVLVSARFSGAHLNPAISLAQYALSYCPAYNKDMSLIKLMTYFIAQTFGAFFGSLCIFALYSHNITLRDADTALLFTSMNPVLIPLGFVFLEQLFSSFFLHFLIHAVTSPRANIPKGMVPVYVGLAIFAVGFSFGTNCGFPLNPARDFAPRVMCSMFGWGTVVWDKTCWVPLIANPLGMLLSAATLAFLIIDEKDYKSLPANDSSVQQ